MQLIFDSDAFSKYIKLKRLEADYSFRQLSREIEISAGTLCRMENKTRIPDVNTLANICEWLGMDMKLFFKNGKKK